MSPRKVSKTETMSRVIVTRPVVGLCHMQVCAVNDATDEEILLECNLQNQSGTTNGWSYVCRNVQPDEFWGDAGPKQCAEHSDRIHYLVAC